MLRIELDGMVGMITVFFRLDGMGETCDFVVETLLEVMMGSDVVMQVAETILLGLSIGLDCLVGALFFSPETRGVWGCGP